MLATHQSDRSVDAILPRFCLLLLLLLQTLNIQSEPVHSLLHHRTQLFSHRKQCKFVPVSCSCALLTERKGESYCPIGQAIKHREFLFQHKKSSQRLGHLQGGKIYGIIKKESKRKKQKPTLKSLGGKGFFLSAFSRPILESSNRERKQ